MSVREHTWEITVTTFSWIIAIAALAGVIAFVVFDAIRTRSRARKVRR